MIFAEARDEYWKYYISLETQFIETGCYVEFDYINNGKTYSMEYLKLFQAVCSEVDVVGKVLASVVDPTYKSTKKTGINEWWFIITNKDISLESMKCSLFGEHDLQPWKDYRVIKNNNTKGKRYVLDNTRNPIAKTPSWWKDYTSVKHDRTGRNEKQATNYTKANLYNLFYSFAALYVLEQKLMENLRSKNESISTGLESKLFTNQLSFYTYLLSIN